ncbi:hypothetical protein [Thalassotalea piscium]|uniref:ABC-type uncharacterized transport system permease subunit n=1 Tax=Thalassotalea piscium TaxID=1230533 RepID=A0A7X0NFR9_9GAMM|nr:hypothetical protein [Thalassotalea piscium]MBB6542658.1 ABC-type uncharacterized transport system permease subunit [Thalassotalea piscium]
MTLFKKNVKSIGITIRVLIALIGGFVLANLIGIIISYLPADNKVDGIVKGMMIGFIAYTTVVIYVFSTKTAGKAGLVVGSSCLVAYAIMFYLNTAVN